MKKQIFMALLAAVSSFAMVSCGDDDKNNDPKPAGQTTTEAKYSQTSNSVSVEIPVDAGEFGAQSWKHEYKFSNGLVTEHTSTVVCSSTMLAQMTYEEWKQSETEGHDDVKNVSANGNTILIEYEIEEGMTETEAIIISKMLAISANVSGVELTKEEQEYFMNQGNDGNDGDYEDIPTDLGGITEG